ncbi:hypothetical protein EDEG_00670 [Edhazardia aedis USNM 41457]|uniref:Uncharacterized protein n=1 Tax=Edhazardia aedis (strain USNM 41457) TaxID=1003232 RepID=J9DCR6_EDHAE|nr:hypothetical protein EDEG_00670 [Edhazardia aedis USNM 41457]|eukprot:EJW05259.1 hypothetical protein EDEG_00670 [Edhazardia aedis USNM 41457]
MIRKNGIIRFSISHSLEDKESLKKDKCDLDNKHISKKKFFNRFIKQKNIKNQPKDSEISNIKEMQKYFQYLLKNEGFRTKELVCYWLWLWLKQHMVTCVIF